MALSVWYVAPSWKPTERSSTLNPVNATTSDHHQQSKVAMTRPELKNHNSLRSKIAVQWRYWPVPKEVRVATWWNPTHEWIHVLLPSWCSWACLQTHVYIIGTIGEEVLFPNGWNRHRKTRATTVSTTMKRTITVRTGAVLVALGSTTHKIPNHNLGNVLKASHISKDCTPKTDKQICIFQQKLERFKSSHLQCRILRKVSPSARLKATK